MPATARKKRVIRPPDQRVLHLAHEMAKLQHSALEARVAEVLEQNQKHQDLQRQLDKVREDLHVNRLGVSRKRFSIRTQEQRLTGTRQELADFEQKVGTSEKEEKRLLHLIEQLKNEVAKTVVKDLPRVTLPTEP